MIAPGATTFDQDVDRPARQCGLRHRDDPLGDGLRALLTAATLVARTAPGADHLGPFQLMLRSVADPRAAEIIRDGIERHVGADLAARVDGPHGTERAELALALIAGVWLMRTVIGTEALRAADPALLTDRLQAMLSAVVEDLP